MRPTTAAASTRRLISSIVVVIFQDGISVHCSRRSISDNSPMCPAANSSPIACTTAPLPGLDVELLIVPWFEGEALGDFNALDRATNDELSRALSSGEFAARAFDLFVTPLSDPAWKPRRVALIGAGPRAGLSVGLARR